MRRIFLALVVLALAAPAVRAQQGGAWPAYAGCWAPGDPESGSPAPAGVVARCIVPGPGADRATIYTVHGGSIIDRLELAADGSERAIVRDGCTGTERATWTGGGARLVVKGTMTCTSGPSGVTTTILDMASPSGWLQVSGIRAGGNVEARPQWYRRAATDSTWPAEVRAVANVDGPAASLARVAAATTPSLDEIARIATNADDAIVRAWLVSRHMAGRPTLAVSGQGLLALKRAGVSGAVTDVLVAIANPENFELRAGTPGRTAAVASSDLPMRPRVAGYSWATDPMCMGPWSPASWLYYSPWMGGYYAPAYAYDGCPGGAFGYGYAPFGRGWSLGLAYGYPYGSPYLGYGGGWWGRPVGAISPVVRGPDTRTTLSRTGGYTPRGSGQDAGRTASGGSTGNSVSSGSSRDNGGGSAAGSSNNSGGRTAVRKP